MFYKKELLENMSQGARLKFIRENKVIKLNDIAEYLGFTDSNIEYFQKLKIYIKKYKEFQEINKKIISVLCSK